MTTIAASRKHKTIACDRQFTYMGNTKMQGGTKILQFPDGFVSKYFGGTKGFIGFSGNADCWGDVVSWILTQEGKPPKCRNIEFLVLTDQAIYHATTMTNWTEIPDKHWAIGSGYSHALTAMDLDRSPLDAVKFAAKRDTHTGMGYRSYEL